MLDKKLVTVDGRIEQLQYYIGYILQIKCIYTK